MLADLGYLGLVADYDLPPQRLPHRKPRRSKKCPDAALTDAQRAEKFPEARGVISQTGRPNDDTDATGFFNQEFFVDLKPADQWKRPITKDELIAEMKQQLKQFRGVNFNFSQPIPDNVEEAVSGVKGSMAVKINGDHLEFLDKKADTLFAILQKVPGIEDLGVFRNLGQPELHITLDPDKMAQYR